MTEGAPSSPNHMHFCLVWRLNRGDRDNIHSLQPGHGARCNLLLELLQSRFQCLICLQRQNTTYKRRLSLGLAFVALLDTCHVSATGYSRVESDRNSPKALNSCRPKGPTPMAPTSAFINQTVEKAVGAKKPGLGQSLVIGSLKTAQDGSYQSLISDLTAGGSTVDKLLFDRIIDQGQGKKTLRHSSCSRLPHIIASRPIGCLKFDRDSCSSL